MTSSDFPALPAQYAHRIAHQAIFQHRAQHTEQELAALLAILAGHDTHTILEIGTADGGSAWAWCQLPATSRVITVDVRIPDDQAMDYTLNLQPITRVTGDSTDTGTRAQVLQALAGRQADMLFIDGDHTGPRPKIDWLLYHGLLRPGGLIVLHDTQGYPGRDDFTTPALWAELTRTYDHLELVARPGGPGGTGILWT